MDNRKLIIFGTGETARIAAEYFMHDTQTEVAAFMVDDLHKKDDHFMGKPVVAFSEAPHSFPPSDFVAFAAIGSSRLNHDRAKITINLKEAGYNLISYVSSKAFVWHDVVIGENCFVLENNVIQSGVTIGDNTTLWSGNHIGHKTTIGSHCFITSHAVISGFCEIGDHSFIGVNASVADKVKIADHNFIGMAAVINKNTEADAIYTGNPVEKSKLSARRFCKV